MIPPIGPSTIAFLTMIVVTASAFVGTWVEGAPSVALAATSAALTALMGLLRTWQATKPEPGKRR